MGWERVGTAFLNLFHVLLSNEFEAVLKRLFFVSTTSLLTANQLFKPGITNAGDIPREVYVLTSVKALTVDVSCNAQFFKVASTVG